MRKVYVNMTVRAIIQVEDGVPIDDVINDTDYTIAYLGDEATVIDTELIDYEIMDSK